LIFARGYPIQAEDVRRALESLPDENRSSDRPGERGTTMEEEEALRSVVRQHLSSRPWGSPHRDVLDLVDRLLVVEALRLKQGNQTHAAKLLGLTRPTLQAKMQRYSIRRETSVRDD
jgi:DNA-binding NtrC family response regulator